MRRRRAFLVLLALNAGSLSWPEELGGIVTEMTPQLIERAIKDGQKKPKFDLSTMAKRAPGFHPQGLFCVLTTPYSRVVSAAHRAFAEYKPFTPEEVTPEMIAPEARIIAAPLDALALGGPLDVRAIVMMDGKTPLQPTRTEATERTLKNRAGAVYSAKDMTAVFPLSALVQGREIRIVYEGDQERRVALDLSGVR